MNVFSINIVVIIFISLSSCTTISNQSNAEYYKRDNSVYADPFLYESVIKLQQNTFVFAEYKEQFNASVYRGDIRTEGSNKKLVVKETKVISLNTGQPIHNTIQKTRIELELIKSKNDEIEIRKYNNGNLDSTFRYRPFKSIHKLNDIEKQVLDENLSSIHPFWELKRSDISTPPKPKMSESEIQLRSETEELNAQRQENVQKLISKLASNCSVEIQDSIIIRLTTKPDGKIETYKIVKSHKEAKKIVTCIDEFMRHNPVNLGQLKVIPNAKTGENASSITYTLPIK